MTWRAILNLVIGRGVKIDPAFLMSRHTQYQFIREHYTMFKYLQWHKLTAKAYEMRVRDVSHLLVWKYILLQHTFDAIDVSHLVQGLIDLFGEKDE
jgi:hypothetical protein